MQTSCSNFWGIFELKVKPLLASIPAIPATTLLISFVVHGVVIWMPIADSTPPPQAKPEEEVNVRVVRLPKPAPSPFSPVKPKSKAAPPAQTPGQRQVSARRSPPPKAAPANTKPAPTAQPKTQQSKPTQAPQTPETTTTTASSTVVNPDPTPSPAKPLQPNDLLVDLSQLAGTTPCQSEDGCWTSANSQWRSVKQDVAQQIRQQGYEVADLELEDDTGFKVSQVLKNGEVKYYLHLLSTDGGTLFVLNAKQLSRAETEAKMTAQKSSTS